MESIRIIFSAAIALSLLALSGCEEKEPVKADNGLPAECNEYVTVITICVNKISDKHKERADQFTAQLNAVTQSWKQASGNDKEVLKASCKAAMQAFKPTLASLGC